MRIINTMNIFFGKKSLQFWMCIFNCFVSFQFCNTSFIRLFWTDCTLLNSRRVRVRGTGTEYGYGYGIKFKASSTGYGIFQKNGYGYGYGYGEILEIKVW